MKRSPRAQRLTEGKVPLCVDSPITTPACDLCTSADCCQCKRRHTHSKPEEMKQVYNMKWGSSARVTHPLVSMKFALLGVGSQEVVKPAERTRSPLRRTATQGSFHMLTLPIYCKPTYSCFVFTLRQTSRSILKRNSDRCSSCIYIVAVLFWQIQRVYSFIPDSISTL